MMVSAAEQAHVRVVGRCKVEEYSANALPLFKGTSSLQHRCTHYLFIFLCVAAGPTRSLRRPSALASSYASKNGSFFSSALAPALPRPPLSKLSLRAQVGVVLRLPPLPPPPLEAALAGRKLFLLLFDSGGRLETGLLRKGRGVVEGPGTAVDDRLLEVEGEVLCNSRSNSSRYFSLLRASASPSSQL